jgi:hypothetical protein
MSKIGKLAEDLRAVPKKLVRAVAVAGVPTVVDALKADYPAEHVRTGAARNAIEGKVSGGKIRLKAGVRKKASKSGKRRASRTGKVNYGQFLPWLLNDDAVIEAALDRVVEGLDVL